MLYRKALRVDPQCMLAAEGLATLLTDEGTKLKLAGQADLGFAKYKEAAQLYPSYAPAHYNMGIMYAERGQTDEALKARTAQANRMLHAVIIVAIITRTHLL